MDSVPDGFRSTAAFRHIGSVVDHETDGRTGYERGLSTKYDAAVVDVMLPSMDGIEIVRGWRTSGVTIPVVILSARSSAEEKIIGLEAGADDYLGKPFSVAELVARVQTVMRRMNRVSETVLKADDLECIRAGCGQTGHKAVLEHIRAAAGIFTNDDTSRFVVIVTLPDHIVVPAEEASHLISMVSSQSDSGFPTEAIRSKVFSHY